jgi:hypothetical protein
MRFDRLSGSENVIVEIYGGHCWARDFGFRGSFN